MTTAATISEVFVLFNVATTVNAVMVILLLLMRRMEFHSYNMTKVSICRLTGSHQSFHLGSNFKSGQVKTFSSSMECLH